ncbi:hypothetical protein [Microcoleus sp. D2_18a_D3]|uniref:hypothetical protein n=1 Tax=Microcoleus sp. D2_18a_D3 TaxID=3055330 RepID=UPI002FD7456F
MRFSDIECHKSGDDGERMGVGVRSAIIYLARHFHCVGCLIFGILINIKHKKLRSPLTEWIRKGRSRV